MTIEEGCRGSFTILRTTIENIFGCSAPSGATIKTTTTDIPIITATPETDGMVDNGSMVIDILVETDASGLGGRMGTADNTAHAITGTIITDTLDRESSLS